MTIKAIETSYKGYRFRSRLEARWAVFFDALGVKWEYEKEGFHLGNGVLYLPDFYISDMPGYEGDSGGFIEIKPMSDDISLTHVYLAGKIEGTNWRDLLEKELFEKTERLKVIGPDYESHDISNDSIVIDCLTSIDKAEYIFANVDGVDSPGTLIEIGYARAKNKNLLVRFDSQITADSSWFLRNTVEGAEGKIAVGGNMSDLLLGVLPKLSSTFDRCRKLSKYKRTFLMQGDPMECHIVTFYEGYESNFWEGCLPRFFNSLMGIKESITENATKKARSARFEFGESGSAPPAEG